MQSHLYDNIKIYTCEHLQAAAADASNVESDGTEQR